ncbi:hypothetical protein AVV30_gp100 [Vibrio phage phi 1]|uniref:Uncharacterized protein n=1 Tax=Vibrio phage phi 1 TaxID=1589297 RepID=A0A0B5H8N7_9CAUD|nr:hypothetical protein AVV30_gp100 [Vibrio phage phi 1]AJF40758.1 hypothetical protein SBVP1_0100 [Vibrio phage phi 1]
MKLAHTYKQSFYILNFVVSGYSSTFYIRGKLKTFTYTPSEFFKLYCKPYPRFTKEMNQ